MSALEARSQSTLLSILSGLQRPDAASGQIVIDTLHRIARTHGATVLCVSHDPCLVRRADRVLEMGDGVILNDHRAPLAVGAQEDEAVS